MYPSVSSVFRRAARVFELDAPSVTMVARSSVKVFGPAARSRKMCGTAALQSTSAVSSTGHSCLSAAGLRVGIACFTVPNISSPGRRWRCLGASRHSWLSVLSLAFDKRGLVRIYAVVWLAAVFAVLRRTPPLRHFLYVERTASRVRSGWGSASSLSLSVSFANSLARARNDARMGDGSSFRQAKAVSRRGVCPASGR